MIVSLLYIILAVLGLSFLIFIHELGHYYIARREGMKVETFSIGLGRPIYKWSHDGVQWQIGWLLFGGYVKIAGTETTDPNQNVYQIKDGFFGKSPLARIKVLFAGPLVNIIFAFLAFTLLWVMGGREKHFNDYTKKIGWIDPHSQLYANGIRPGDEITAYGEKPYQGLKDHMYAPMTAKTTLVVHGNKIDPLTHEKTPFSYTITPYPHPDALDKDVVTAGILNPASYLLYERALDGGENPFPEGSPLKESGIQYNDRIVWVDGEEIYSPQQLQQVLNNSRTLLTIKRGDQTLQRRVPRVRTTELKLDPNVKEELIDWQFEGQLKGTKFTHLFMIPYDLNNNGVIERKISFIDPDEEKQFFTSTLTSHLDEPLQKGDQIIAVEGKLIAKAYEILFNLQNHYVNIIVERNEEVKLKGNWKNIDELFDAEINPQMLSKLSNTIGTTSSQKSEGNLVLLSRVAPKARNQFYIGAENEAYLHLKTEELRKEIESISNPEKKTLALQFLENQEKQLLLGLPLSPDKIVTYNPNPIELFSAVFNEIWSTLTALFSGSLNPKWMSGPIGIVSVVHHQSQTSLKESLYWLGVISLNLGILNLLPIPVLDGGTICISLFEMVTGIQMKPKTLEKLIIPFALILICFFLFLTYNDVARLLSAFLK
jgi:regulator of sigma E protease